VLLLSDVFVKHNTTTLDRASTIIPIGALIFAQGMGAFVLVDPSLPDNGFGHLSGHQRSGIGSRVAPRKPVHLILDHSSAGLDSEVPIV
jgi:hypothetical protein